MCFAGAHGIGMHMVSVLLSLAATDQMHRDYDRNRHHSLQTARRPRHDAPIVEWADYCCYINIFYGGTPKRASTRQRSVRSTESQAFCRWMKHSNSGVRAFLPNSCSQPTATIISAIERCGRNPHCSSVVSPIFPQLVTGDDRKCNGKYVTEERLGDSISYRCLYLTCLSALIRG